MQPRVERKRGDAAVKQRKRRMERTKWLCEDCKAEGRYVPAKVVDHIKPLALGGSDEDSNTRNLCHSHHQIRTAEQFGHRKKVKIGVDGWPVE
jgi:5-methylcytosine-specific restriction protein A